MNNQTQKDQQQKKPSQARLMCLSVAAALTLLTACQDEAVSITTSEDISIKVNYKTRPSLDSHFAELAEKYKKPAVDRADKPKRDKGVLALLSSSEERDTSDFDPPAGAGSDIAILETVSSPASPAPVAAEGMVSEEAVAFKSKLAEKKAVDAASGMAARSKAEASRRYDPVIIMEEDEPRHDFSPVQNVSSGLLSAGAIDDSLNLGDFASYVKRASSHYYQHDWRSNHYEALPYINYNGVSLLRFSDAGGMGIGNSKIQLEDLAGNVLYNSYTSFDGYFSVLPYEHGIDTRQPFRVRLFLSDGSSRSAVISLDTGKHHKNRLFNNQGGATQMTADFDIQVAGYHHQPVTALDVMLVIDSTGSMADELRYLQAEFDNIINRLQHQYKNVSIRVGLEFYRDQGDRYVVRGFPFTSNLAEVKRNLSAQRANGGGDYPEAMDQAIASGLSRHWREGNSVSRMMFLVADAPPHHYALKKTLELMKQAREMGVHLYPLAASGAADTSEYIMRVGAQLTHGQYLFLTDDSGVGLSHAEPKVACYQVSHLDRLLERVIASELSGYRIEAAKSDIIRETGNYKQGVCS